MARTALFSRQQAGGAFSFTNLDQHPGEILFVHSGTGTDAAGYGQNPDAPLATIDYAIGLCTANKGDVIYVLPGHAETIAVAGGITADVAGVSIIGLGNGSNRPTITFSATGSTFAISAANVLVKNLRITCTAATTKMFSITAAGVTLDAVDYVEGAGIPLQFVLTTNAADQLTIRNCRHVGATAGASAQLWIQLVGTDDTRIVDNVFILALQNGATCAVINATTAVVNCLIQRNTILQTGGTTQVSAILLVTASTGFVSDNRVAAAVTTLAGIIALASAYGAENYALNTVNKSGILDPVVDS